MARSQSVVAMTTLISYMTSYRRMAQDQRMVKLAVWHTQQRCTERLEANSGFYLLNVCLESDFLKKV